MDLNKERITEILQDNSVYLTSENTIQNIRYPHIAQSIRENIISVQ